MEKELTKEQSTELTKLVTEFHKDFNCTIKAWALRGLYQSTKNESSTVDAEYLSKGTGALHTWYRWRVASIGVDYNVFRNAYAHYLETLDAEDEETDENRKDAGERWAKMDAGERWAKMRYLDGKPNEADA